MKLSKFTSRGMKDTSLLLTTRFLLGDRAQVCPLGEGEPACHPTPAQEAHVGGWTQLLHLGAQGLLPNSLRSLHPGRYSLTVLQSTHKNQIFTEIKSSQYNLFQADFSCWTLTRNRHFCYSSKNQHPMLCTCLFSLLLASAHGKIRTSRLLCPKSTPAKTPKKSRGMFGGRLWTCIYSLELQCSLSRKNCWELRKSGILYNGLNSWWFQSSQKASQEGPDFAAWSISVPKGHGGMENRDTVFMVNWILLFSLWRARGLFELWMMAPIPALCVTYSSIDRVHTLSLSQESTHSWKLLAPTVYN